MAAKVDVSTGVDPIIWEQAKVDNPEPERWDALRWRIMLYMQEQL